MLTSASYFKFLVPPVMIKGSTSKSRDQQALVFLFMFSTFSYISTAHPRILRLGAQMIEGSIRHNRCLDRAILGMRD